MSIPIDDLQSLHAHGEWADRRLLEAARAAAGAPPDALREMCHVRGAQEVWLSRIEGRPPALAVWPELTPAELESAGATVDAAWRSFLAALQAASLGRQIEYSNSAGRAFSTPLGEILLHLMTHGQYHRGKANAALRAAGADAPGLDYIMWQREQPASVARTD